MRKEKGLFGRLGLKVSGHYIFPSPQRRLILAGSLLAVLAFALTLADVFFRSGSFLSSGPLSSSHALLEEDCGSCHALGGVTDENCSRCHERLFGATTEEAPIYSLQAHYVYRSEDLERQGDPELEPSCAACHGEHKGRTSVASGVSDQRCLSCHPVGSFESGHPQFDVVAEQTPDPAGLKFNHARHTKVFAERLQLEGEQACLYCHEPGPSGMHFDPLDFDRHCGAACHLKRGTEPLPLDGSLPSPGVLTLQQLQSQAPFHPCLSSVQPGDFATAGTSVSKAILHHEDCWIIENLRLLRRSLYPDLGWVGLLAVDGASVGREHYLSAVEHLEGRLAELRRQGGSVGGNLEADLERARRLARRRGIPPRGEAASRPDAASELESILSAAYRSLLQAGAVSEAAPVSADSPAVSRLIDRLTQPCRACHFTGDKGFRPVQTDQRVLKRAEFDHRAHVVQMNCLACHQSLLENEWVFLDEYEQRTTRLSEMHNLPGIESCRGCHRSGAASAACVTCHVFHPDKQRRIERLIIQPERGKGS
ncbi:MAG: hypothetical protein V3T83_21845 [Acidobacteriota bacterium]